MVKTSKYPTEPQTYLSYLLRLWREGDDDRLEWRASLRSTHTGEQVGLGSLEELFRFLEHQTGAAPNAVNDGSAQGGQSGQAGG
jgi:hypothetical protein